MQLKIIAADLDGTLLNHESKLTPVTAEVLRRAHKSGIKIAIATGRAFFTVPEEVRNFPCFDYCIASNGATIYELPSQTPIVNYVLEKASAEALIAYALTHHLGLEMVCGGKAYGEKYYFDHPDAFCFDHRSKQYLSSTRTKIENLDAFVAAHLETLESINFVLQNPADKEKIKQNFSKDTSLYITSSHPRILEFSAKDCGKANALKFLLEREKLSSENLIAFGNADNDLEMMHLAAIGVATANSPPEVQREADAVCGDCNEDGVAIFLMRNAECGTAALRAE